MIRRTVFLASSLGGQMLIDWLTIRTSYDHLNPEALAVVLAYGDRVQRIDAKTGELRWETAAWDSIRSDTHAISVKAGGSELWIQGSPARIIAQGDAVFGAGASQALDISGCIERMTAFVGSMLGVTLPEPTPWIVSRADVTENLRMNDQAEVRQALSILRDCEGGRYRVSQQAGDTVYWGGKSKHRRGKAYAKGPHLTHIMKKPDYSGYPYNPEQIADAHQLLRLELTLAREWFSRNDWKTVTPAQLKSEWDDYFGRMIGGAEMKSDADLKQRVMAAAETEGQGRAAIGCWALIQSQGWEAAREMQSKTTWYRNLKILRAAGLGDADLSRGQVVQLRRKVLECQAVTNWQQLRSA